MNVRDMLRGMNSGAGRSLDAMHKAMPPVKPGQPWQEYLPAALEHARHNEQFARELARSLQQLARLGGV